MKLSLLDTKLFIPSQRPNLIRRPRLLNQLESGLNGKLTLISAPAGFGKSTLVAMWAEKSNMPIGWVSLDHWDNDPALFLTYIFTAINSIGKVGGSVLAEVQSPQRPPENAILNVWINELANHPRKLILILDDYHVIDNPTIHHCVEFLLDYQPPNFHLILISRSDPHLQLGRIRGSGQLTEIREADLRFSSEESLDFFESFTDLHLSAKNISALEQRTEGWAVGLQLAGLALRGRDDVDEYINAFIGGHQFILDYLTEEVFGRQPEEIQDFLIQTSILERFCASLCNAITGETNGAVTIQLLNQLNLFIIPLDDSHQWYRYHHLFVELLRYKMAQLPADQVAEMHGRASLWYAKNDFIAEALYHAMEAKDYSRAADLIEPVTSKMIGRGEVNTVRDWIEALPKSLLKERPRLCISLAWVFNLNNIGDPIEHLLEDAERALDCGAYDEATIAELRGHIATLRGYTALQENNASRALQHMAEAMDWLPEEDVYLRSIVSFTQGVIFKRGCVWDAAEETLKLAETYGRASGNYSIAIGSRTHLIEMLIIQGKLRQAAKFSNDAIEYYLTLQEVDMLANLGYVYTKLAEVLYEWNDMEGAEENLAHGLELSSRIIADWGWKRDGLVYLSRMRQVEGKPEYARKYLEQALEVNEHMQDLYDKMDMTFEEVRLWLQLGNLTAANRWVMEYQSASEARHEQADVMLARVLLAVGEIDKSREILKSVGEAAEATGRMYRLIETLVLQSLVYKTENKVAKALNILAKALQLAEPEMFIRIFVDDGADLMGLLQKLEVELTSEGGETFLFSKKYISKILSAIFSEQLPTTAPEKRELLNGRESQILRLMSAGLKTPEIAVELYLSKNTIKWYVRKIYEKMDVHSKAEAIERGHQLGLLK